ncbi:HAD family hydrolase [Owenweeksia hongkongensis]|uniref:HAD family hydrolase n=1 Tax=Owenweeksia hongkongensis TaxID=253245 RepID=UPI003A8E2FF4
MIKNIIFDFGAVLIPIDESLTWSAFEKLGAKDELKNQQKIFQKYEKGEISTSEFLKKIQPFFFRKIYPPELGNAWNAMLKTLPEERVNFLKRLKKNYRIFLLSNTNELHINHIKKEAGLFSYKQFISQFENVHYSYEMGMRKPDAEIFEKVLKDNNLVAEETFYIDDGKKHIKTAKSLGIETWHFKPEEDDINDLGKVLSKLHS